MTEVTLIRHGQAQTLAKDEASYDRLSELGHEQARCVGDWLRLTQRFDHVVSGAMRRQVETARSLGLEIPHHIDARLNELDYYGLSGSLQSSHGVPFPSDARTFAEHVPQVLDIWRSGNVGADLETYEAFRTRIFSALQDATQREGAVLLVTSTGVIATLAAIALGLETNMKSKMFLAVAHTSVHKFALRGDELHLTQFGATPHLDRPDREHAKTYA